MNMALQGEFIYTGYLAGVGMVRVFNDLDGTQCVFAVSNSGERHYVSRSRVSPRRSTTRPTTVTVETVTQPTLF